MTYEHLYQKYVDELKNRSCREPLSKELILPFLKKLQTGINTNNVELVVKITWDIHSLECGIPISLGGI